MLNLTKNVVRFRTLVLMVTCSLMLVEANADHCDSTSHKAMVFPCEHTNEKAYGKDEDSGAGMGFTFSLPGIFKKIFKGDDGDEETAIDETVITDIENVNVAATDEHGDPIDEEFRLTDHKNTDVDPEDQIDAMGTWAVKQVEDTLKNFPTGTQIDPLDMTITLPTPPAGGEGYCMDTATADGKVGYPQPMSIGPDGEIELEYHHGESLTFPGRPDLDPTVAETGDFDSGQALAFECDQVRWFDIVDQIKGIGKGECRSNRRLLFDPYPSSVIGTGISFVPANNPVYDGGDMGNSGPITAWTVIKIDDDPARAALRLESDKRKNILNEPQECENDDGVEEYWILDCNGKTEYTEPSQPSKIDCCPNPCPPDPPDPPTT